MMCHWHCCQNEQKEGSLLCPTHIKLDAHLKSLVNPPKLAFSPVQLNIAERIALEAKFRSEKEVYPKTTIEGYFAGSANGELAYWRMQAKNSRVK